MKPVLLFWCNFNFTLGVRYGVRNIGTFPHSALLLGAVIENAVYLTQFFFVKRSGCETVTAIQLNTNCFRLVTVIQRRVGR